MKDDKPIRLSEERLKRLEERAGDRGIACPNCGCRDLRVLYTDVRSAQKRKRMRVCRHCGRHVPTVERAAGT